MALEKPRGAMRSATAGASATALTLAAVAAVLLLVVEVSLLCVQAGCRAVPGGDVAWGTVVVVYRVVCAARASLARGCLTRVCTAA